MDHDRRACADQILKAIEYGHIPKKEIERRLYEIIDSELSGPLHAEWDRTKVDLCHELLWELYTNGEEPFPDNAEAIKERVAEKHSAYKHKRKVLIYGLRVAAIVIILVVMVVGMGLFPSVHWMQIVSTKDERQVRITGREISTQSVAGAISSHGQFGEYSFSSADELSQFLRFDPGFPPSLDGSFIPDRYDLSIAPEFIRIACQYCDPAESNDDTISLSVRFTLFTSADNAEIYYEQDSKGEIVTIREMPVYRYSNVGRISYLWMENHTIVRVTARTSFDIADKLVAETIDWRQNK